MPLRHFTNSAASHHVFKTPVLLDAMGFPRYWATVRTFVSGQDWAPTTSTKTLRYIDALYEFADDLKYQGFLDATLTECDFDELGSLLEAYFISLKNRPKLTASVQHQWRAGLSFVRDVLAGIGKNADAPSGLANIEAKLLRLDASYGQLRIQKPRQPATLRSLPAEVINWLYVTLDPESPTNPFKREITRWRVFTAFIIMLHEGLRRGELLLLTVDAVKTEFDKKAQCDRHWINVQNLEVDDSDAGADCTVDTRCNKPSIKTADSIRQIPVSRLTANVILTYTENYRGKADHPFLLNTQWQTPLSHESLTAYFKLVSEQMPKELRKLLFDKNNKTSIDPHDLRHTSAVVRLTQFVADGESMPVALQRLRAFFGWSVNSEMPLRYSRAVFENRNATMWAKIQDDRIELLNAIPTNGD